MLCIYLDLPLWYIYIFGSYCMVYIYFDLISMYIFGSYCMVHIYVWIFLYGIYIWISLECIHLDLIAWCIYLDLISMHIFGSYCMVHVYIWILLYGVYIYIFYIFFEIINTCQNLLLLCANSIIIIERGDLISLRF